MLRKMAQQGKQQSSKMRMPLWSMTPTRFKFLPPKDLEKQCFCEVSAEASCSQQALPPWEPCSLLPCPRGGARPEVGEYGCQAPDSQLTLASYVF